MSDPLKIWREASPAFKRRFSEHVKKGHAPLDLTRFAEGCIHHMLEDSNCSPYMYQAWAHDLRCPVSLDMT